MHSADEDQSPSHEGPSRTGARRTRQKIFRVAPIGKTDAPALVDLLDRDRLVVGLANLITNRKTQAPLTIGLYGPWGSGKSSFLSQLTNKLPRNYPVARFNPWRSSGGEVWPGLIGEIAPLIDKNLGFCQRIQFLLSSDASRAVSKWHTRFVASFKDVTNQITAVVATIALVFTTSSEAVSKSIKGGMAAAIDPALTWLQGQLDEPIAFRVSALTPHRLAAMLVIALLVALAVKKFIGVYRRPFSTQFRANMAVYAARLPDLKSTTFKDFEALRRVIGEFSSVRIKKNQPCLAVLIDDLDRCAPEQVVGILEAVNSFVAELPIVTVIAMDTRFVCNAVAAQHQFLFSKDDGPEVKERYGRLFLEKIVHIPFQLPGVQSYMRYVDDLLKISDEDLNSDRASDFESDPSDPQLFKMMQGRPLLQRLAAIPLIGYMNIGLYYTTRDDIDRKYQFGISFRSLFGSGMTAGQANWLERQDYSKQMFLRTQADEFTRARRSALGLPIFAMWKVSAVARAKIETAAVQIQEQDRLILRGHTRDFRGNPRSIKRFVNTYLLAKGIAALSAPEDGDYRLEDLAAWLVLLQNWPNAGSQLCAAILARESDTLAQVATFAESLDCSPEMKNYLQTYRSALNRLAASRHGMSIAQCFSFYDIDVTRVATRAVSAKGVVPPQGYQEPN